MEMVLAHNTEIAVWKLSHRGNYMVMTNAMRQKLR